MKSSTNITVSDLRQIQITSPAYLTVVLSLILDYLLVGIFGLILFVLCQVFFSLHFSSEVSTYVNLLDSNISLVLVIAVLLIAIHSLFITQMIFPYRRLRIENGDVIIRKGLPNDLKLDKASVKSIHVKTLWYIFVKRDWFRRRYNNFEGYSKICFVSSDGKKYCFLSESTQIDSLIGKQSIPFSKVSHLVLIIITICLIVMIGLGGLLYGNYQTQKQIDSIPNITVTP